MNSSILICDASSTTSISTGTIENNPTECKTGFANIPRVDRITRELPSSLSTSAFISLVSLSEIISLLFSAVYRCSCLGIGRQSSLSTTSIMSKHTIQNEILWRPTV